MKLINKSWVALLVVGFFASCDLDLQDDPNAVTPDNASVELLMNNVFIEFAETCNEMTFATQEYVRLTAMDGSPFYDNNLGPESFDFLWSQAYSTLLPDMEVVIRNSEAAGVTTYSGVAKVMKAYLLFALVDMFGDVPYSTALQGTDQLSPTLDDDEDVYAEALATLESAIADLSDPKGSAIKNDLYYGGNTEKWLKLANTLKLRYYVITRHVTPGALDAINAYANDLTTIITANADDFQFQYGSNRENPDSRHPYYTDGYENGGPSWYQSNYRMWTMFGEKNVEDPRLRYYYYRQDCDETDEDAFTLQCQAQPYPFHWPAGWPYCTASGDFGDPLLLYGGSWGRDQGDNSGIPPDDLKRTAFGIYPCGGKFDNDDCRDVSRSGTDGLKGRGIEPIVLACNVHFYFAEAKLVGGDNASARSFLESGIRLSIQKVLDFGASDAGSSDLVPSQGEVNAYVAEVLSLYDAAASTDDKLDVIMKEAWLANQGQGLEAYNGYRRTCKPSGMQLSLEVNPGPFPRTLWYPASVVNRNENIDQKPDLTGKVFWDANPNGCELQ
jgi:hypothetical protein